MVTVPGEPDAFSAISVGEPAYDNVDVELRIPQFNIKGEARQELRTLFWWKQDLNGRPLPPDTVAYIQHNWYGLGPVLPYDARAKAIRAIARGDWSHDNTQIALMNGRAASILPSSMVADDVHARSQEASQERLGSLRNPLEQPSAPHHGEVDASPPEAPPTQKSRPRELRLKPSRGRFSQTYEGRRKRTLQQKVNRGEYPTIEAADAATPRRGIRRDGKLVNR
jgi:hypothetical protein